MTTQPPIPPTNAVPDLIAAVPEVIGSAPSADSADSFDEGLVIIQDTPVIDATKLSESSSDQG
ncbi:MAG: hypothetical protein QM619_07260 [Micropruina sp.]|uniref:hypothetical protein n=1 Tax=Micropruina sp. TaxID=2737536 RepID=UPI0039E2BB48